MANSSEDVFHVLTCWKEIAQYLGKGVRTVQRWELDLDLPVRRPNRFDHKSPVSSDPRDLDLWLKTRWTARTERTSKIPVSADEALPPGDRPLSEVIQAHRELRLAHKRLRVQTSMAIEALKQNCAELSEHLKS